ncbi:hypothetical protein SLS60_005507 [Paraconiothyrium brasiliense]|uniref:Uncharacterized protein n=1 Tax=Paraconiothyrium brasiliense TaxID=300254 RepID=A0ABR3RHL1_9PLEO
MLRDLGTLTVRLDGEPIESVKIGGCWERLEELLPLNLSSRYGKYGLKEWERLVQRLAECIRPDHLTLYLIVNVKDIATAQTVLMPLYQLPRLKECGLWLNKEHIPELSMLAQDTVRRLKKPVHTDQPFKYLDLPIETRWRILEYSDLVYDKALEWKPRLSSLGKMPRPNCSCIEYVHGYMVDEGLHLPDCTTSDMDATELQDMDDWKTEYSAEHCCYRYKNRSRFHCKVTHTGFCECIFNCKHSAYSSGFMLGPRDGAHPLFLVSKQVHQDAVPIFFQRNRFLVLPPGKAYAYRPLPIDWPPAWGRRVIIPMHRLEISLFLSSIARNALQHIRYLEWLLPQFKNYTTAPKSAYLDYLDTIELMAQAMNLPLLTLVVDLRMEYPYRDWESDWEPYLGRLPADGAVYDRILQPLRRLEGLKDFFVYLRRLKSVPVGAPQYHLRRAYDNDERKYEKAVMGANYDSRRRAKPWMNRFETRLWRYRDRGDEYERWRSREYSNYDPGMDEW